MGQAKGTSRWSIIRNFVENKIKEMLAKYFVLKDVTAINLFSRPDISLRDVQLRDDALNDLKLPIRVEQGHAKQVSVSWPKLQELVPKLIGHLNFKVEVSLNNIQRTSRRVDSSPSPGLPCSITHRTPVCVHVWCSGREPRAWTCGGDDGRGA